MLCDSVHTTLPSGLHPAHGWIGPLLLLLLSQGVWGQGYEVHKLVMTGDEVPGDTAVTERFAYFAEVHIFEDGEVAFGGITTRTGYVFRNRPRGIYLSNTSGALSVIVEIDDAEAWKSIGLPYSGMDSDDSKTFAFNYLNPTDTALLPVLAKKALGGDVVKFNPDDGSSMLVSSAALPEDTFYEGNFIDLGYPMMNALGQMLFGGTFEFTGEPENDQQGYFVASEASGVRNVVFVGDAAPGFSDATITALGSAVLADNGHVFIKATLSGTDVSHTMANDEILWMEDEGTFTEILREGSAAPGLPDWSIGLTALYMQVIAINGNHMVVFAGASSPAGSLRRVFWHANTDGTELTPMFHYDDYPVLEVADYFTATDRGAVAFSSVDANAILMDDGGNVYFTGGGQFENGTDIGGIWKYNSSGGGIVLLEPVSLEAGGLFSFYLVSVNNVGGLAFYARDYIAGIRGIWTRSPSGSLRNLAKVGDLVHDRPITGFALHSGTTTLGSPQRLSQINDEGDVVFVVTFADTGDDDDSYSDEAIMLASAIPPPTQRYLWNGEAGDDDWHKVLNWDDEETGEDATTVPGIADGTEEATIESANVVITETPVHLAALTATGSLTVDQPLTLEQTSYIEGLTLRANLVANGELSLVGQSEWLGGSISGDGEVDLLPAGQLVISPTLGSCDLHMVLNVEGELTQESVTLNLQGEYGKVFILPDGQYVIDTGRIVDFSEGVHFLNEGTLTKNTAGTFTFDAFFENGRSGNVEIYEGTLLFQDPSAWAGELLVQPGAAVEFRNTQVNIGSVTRDGFYASGYGTFLLADSLVHVGADTESQVGMADEGKLQLTGTTEISGSGLLYITGNTECSSATITAPLVTWGDWNMSGGTISGLLTNEGVFTLKGDRLEGTLVNAEDFVIHGGTVSGDFENRGILFVEQSTDAAPLDTSDLMLFNVAGGSFTAQATDLTVLAINNDGVIILRDATLTIDPGRLQNNGQLAGIGVIQGEVVNDSLVSPGESIGVLTIDGDYTQAGSGVLLMEVDGEQPGLDFDQLVVTGAAMLDGRLRVMVSYGFLPPSGTQLRILQAGSRTGEFSELTVENTSSRLEFEQLPDPTGIVLSVSHRELATFLEWQTASFSAQDLTNPAVSGAQADPDGDRFANALEYALDLRPSLVDDNPLSFGVERDESGTPVAITLSFPWAKGMTDAEYEVVRSSDLNDWETVETVIVKIEDRGTCNKLTLSPIPFLKTEQSAYVQLIVALTPQIVEP